MSNVIQFPMDRIRATMPALEAIDVDDIMQQAFDLEQESLQVLAQAKAIEEQSQRVLDLMTDLENY